MNNNFFKKTIFIFLFLTFFSSINCVNAATGVSRNSKKYQIIEWSKACVAAGGECINKDLYNTNKTGFEVKTDVKCANAASSDNKIKAEDQSANFICVKKSITGKGDLCTRCSDEKGCTLASFYTPTGTACNKDAMPILDANKNIVNKDTDLKYISNNTQCSPIGEDPKFEKSENANCKVNSNGCSTDFPECVSGAIDASKYTVPDPKISCGNGGICAKSTTSAATCGGQNKCETGATCTNGTPVAGTCSEKGQICCPITATCTTPNTCLRPSNGTNSYNNNGSCTLNGQQFAMAYCTTMQASTQNGINGCLISNKFIPVPCTNATYNTTNAYGANNGSNALGWNSVCSNGGTPIATGQCANGATCCSQASSLGGLVQGLTSSLGNWLNSLFNPSATTGSSTSTPNILTPTPSLTPTPTPAVGSLNNPNGVDVTFNLKLKFQGTVIGPKIESKSMKVKVTIVDTTVTSGTKSAVSSGDFTTASGSAGIWTGAVTFTKVEPKQAYQLLIKGPKHVQKKICTNSPTEASPGTYSCTDLLNVVAGDNTLDLTGIYMMSGDLPTQDGVVNSVDFGNVRTRFGKMDYTSLETADINLDGAINSLDFSLILQTLQTTDGIDQK